ncbi:hypothetical protein O4J55_06800 [Paracoccus sp. PXZ]
MPIFLWRHYVTDKGRFPAEALEDLGLANDATSFGPRRAGILPYLALAAGLAVVVVANMVFQLPG